MPQRSKDQRTGKPSLATRLYANLPAENNQVKSNRVDGWAPLTQRAKWGDNVDHVSRQYVSPLGGQVKRGK
jgi:hypothetical protein